MPASFIVVKLFDSAVSIRLADPDGAVAELLRDVLADLTIGLASAHPAEPVRAALWVTRRAGHHVLVDESDDSVNAHHREGRAFVTQVVHRLNRVALDLDPHRLHLHAAAVTRNDGAGVLIAGASGAGKSTLTTDLLRVGGAYLGDELVALGDVANPLELHGQQPRPSQVVGYPKPISLKGASITRFAAFGPRSTAEGWAELPASSVAPVVPAARAGVVVFPRYVAGAASASIQIGPAEATKMLLASTMDAERYGVRSLGALARMAVSATCVVLTIGDDGDAAARIVDSVGQPHRSGPLRMSRVRSSGPSHRGAIQQLTVAMMADGNLAMDGSGITFGDIASEQLERIDLPLVDM